ncbi:hypothetical protein [Paracoccus albus]|uniref:hypothetical protein n=1 Tax=Paracoccus albus TaxID=3017784 RepID=UPI0022EFDE5C|nr:hypothetical protein [Paracoccus albus]WBU60187.1 hypothetical protein PAF20_15840 [Paracoccus albus]
MSRFEAHESIEQESNGYLDRAPFFDLQVGKENGHEGLKMAEWVATKVLKESWDAECRIAEMGLSTEGLINAVRAARTASGNATALHPSNAAGTFGYHEGIASLRQGFIGEKWRIDRKGGVETIRNDEMGLRIGFCNVDRACGEKAPKPRSDKGAASERACGPMLFDPDELRYFVRDDAVGHAFYYLMVDGAGRAEITRPKISGKTFEGAVERIFLLPEGDEEDTLLNLDDEGIAEDFEPKIVRK